MKKYYPIFLLIIATILQAQVQADCSPFVDKTEFIIDCYNILLGDNGLTVNAQSLWQKKKYFKEQKKEQKVVTRQLFSKNNFQKEDILYNHLL